MVYDSGRYEENMNHALHLADWDGFKSRQREARKRGKLLGRGLANYVESSIGAQKGRRGRTGQANAAGMAIGSNRAGKGNETSSRKLAADCSPCPSGKCGTI